MKAQKQKFENTVDRILTDSLKDIYKQKLTVFEYVKLNIDANMY